MGDQEQASKDVVVVCGQRSALVAAICSTLIVRGESFKVDRMQQDYEWAWFVRMTQKGSELVEHITALSAGVQVTGVATFDMTTGAVKST